MRTQLDFKPMSNNIESQSLRRIQSNISMNHPKSMTVVQRQFTSDRKANDMQMNTLQLFAKKGIQQERMKSLGNCSNDLCLMNDITKTSNDTIRPQKSFISILNHIRNQRVCVLCKKLDYHKIELEGCSHCFCDRCIHILINDKFIEKDNHFKCPLTKCFGHMNFEALKVLYLVKKDSKEEHDGITNHQNKKTSTIIHSNSNDQIKIYPKKTTIVTIDSIVSNYSRFLFFIKNIKRICRNCESDKLFCPYEGKMYTCLNCQKRMCKKCLKFCDEKHFDPNNINHCPLLTKQYKKIKPLKLKDIIKHYPSSLLSLILGYIVLFFGFTLHAKHFLNCQCIYNQRLTYRLLYYSVEGLCYIILGLYMVIELLIIVLLFPYYSCILLLFDVIE